MDITPAALVQALAGRDKGRYFVVLKLTKEGNLLISDGKKHKKESPKLKNPKHVKHLGYSLELIKNKLDKGIEINNSDIRKSIRAGLLELEIL